MRESSGKKGALNRRAIDSARAAVIKIVGVLQSLGLAVATAPGPRQEFVLLPMAWVDPE